MQLLPQHGVLAYLSLPLAHTVMFVLLSFAHGFALPLRTASCVIRHHALVSAVNQSQV